MSDHLTPPSTLAPGERFMRLPEVMATTGLGKSNIYALMEADPPAFPQRRRIGPNTVIWLETEVRAWMAARLRNAA